MGFRRFVMRLAIEYHLNGEVWNCTDGSVVAMLQTQNAGNLDRALQLLHKGPGDVERVETEPLAPEPSYVGFSVAATRYP